MLVAHQVYRKFLDPYMSNKLPITDDFVIDYFTTHKRVINALVFLILSSNYDEADRLPQCSALQKLPRKNT